jgi:predicted alpha/beta hydrolase
MNTHHIKHITIFALQQKTKSNANVLLVGNAYGIMPYITPLANKLHAQGYNVFWFAFSGQENTNGSYSYKECTNDIRIISEWIIDNYPNLPYNIISHCAGSLMTIEYLKNNPENKVKKLIIYGLLYAMDRRRTIAERKLKQCNVQYNLSEQDWGYRPLKTLSQINVPILFCHAKDKLNLDRASEEEMDLVMSHASNGRIKWFENGYDSDLNNIEQFINNYVAFLRD